MHFGAGGPERLRRGSLRGDVMGYATLLTKATRALLGAAAAVLALAGALPARAQDAPTGSWSAESSYDPAGGNFEMGATATDGTYLYIVGGLQDGSAPASMKQVRRYDPVANTWQTLAALPFTLTDSAAAIHDGVIYLFGGTT